MGKAAKLKQLRKFASKMPVIAFRTVQGERVLGEELIKQGIKEVDSKPVDPKIFYRKKSVVTKQLNHYRKMKTMYNRNGKAGANSYAIAVDKYVKNKNNETKKAQTETL